MQNSDIYSKFYYLITKESILLENSQTTSIDYTFITFNIPVMEQNLSGFLNLLYVTFTYYVCPVLISLYFSYKLFNVLKSTLNGQGQRSSSKCSGSDVSILDAKQRMKLFNERKAALISKAREAYLRKHKSAAHESD